MALNPVGNTIHGRLPDTDTGYFLLGQSATGLWVIREETGRKAGLFRTRQAAIKYARDESPDGNFIIEHLPDGLELDQLELKRVA